MRDQIKIWELQGKQKAKRGPGLSFALLVLVAVSVLGVGPAMAEPAPGAGRRVMDIDSALTVVFGAVRTDFVDTSRMSVSFWESAPSPEPGVGLQEYCTQDPDFLNAVRGVIEVSLYAEYFQQAFRSAGQRDPAQSFAHTSRYDRLYDYLALGGRYFLRFIEPDRLLQAFQDELSELTADPDRAERLRIGLNNLLEAYPLVELLDAEGREDFYQDLATQAYFGTLPQDYFIQGLGAPCMKLGFEVSDLSFGGREAFMTMPSLEVVYLSFWARRFHEGNADLARTLIEGLLARP